MVDMVTGSVFVRGWDGVTVKVEECLGGAVKQKGNTIILDGTHRCSCIIYLPRDSDVDIDGTDLAVDMAGIRGQGRIDCTGGTVAVEGWQGDLAIDSTSATVQLRNCQGKASIDTTSGDVEICASQGNIICDTSSGTLSVQDCSGSVYCDTGAGKVQIVQFSGPVNVETSSGDVVLRYVFGRNVHAECGSGSIHASLPGPFPSQWKLVTQSGGIELEVPENASARFEFQGCLDIDDLNLNTLVRTGNQVTGTLGAREGRVVAVSFSGPVIAHRGPALMSNEVHWQVQDEEALKILRMLESGAISIDEADKLLGALNGEENQAAQEEDRGGQVNG